MIGTITLNLEGATLEETERCRGLIHTLLQQGVFAIKRGHAIIHFDNDGTLQEIEIYRKVWRKPKE